MNNYSKQIAAIVTIARHFAMMNYHVTTTFFSKRDGCEVTIFFYNINDQEEIESYLRIYKDDDNIITFDSFPGENNARTFYTLKLKSS